jgi:hypothetical protein
MEWEDIKGRRINVRRKEELDYEEQMKKEGKVKEEYREGGRKDHEIQ